MVAHEVTTAAYLNWDYRPHRRAILSAQWSPDTTLLIFDELHKYRKWKGWIKGVWDTRQPHQRIIVTGSSRLDVYRRGGDSLMGRYHYYRLHPFSLREVCETGAPSPAWAEPPERLTFRASGTGLDHLLKFGGFPEPFLAGSERVLRRWQKERFERVFREDIRDVEMVRALSEVEIMGGMLPERVGAPLSMNSLAVDLEVSPKTAKLWIDLLCRNYYLFRVPPYARRLARALKKEAKYYLWDWSEVRGAGERFENMVAAHLLKLCHYCQDVFGYAVDLFYLRDLEKREADFLVTWQRVPWLIVECKTTPGASLTPLHYFAERLNVKERYVVTQQSGVDYLDRRTGIRSLSADRFLMALA
jgi:predicted AAA+ superfamily ATPase